MYTGRHPPPPFPTMYIRWYIQQYRFFQARKGDYFSTRRLASNCAYTYTRLRWLLRELLSFLCYIICQYVIIWLTLGGCMFSWKLLYSYFTLRQCDVYVPVRHKITNALILQQAAVIPRPTGSHYVLPRSCAPLHGAGGASRKPLYILCTSK